MEFENHMEKLKRSFLVILSILTMSSCANVKWASIKNETDEHLMIKATFVSKYGTQVMEMPIKAGENNTWQYEQSSFDTSKIDKYLSSIEVSNSKGCLLLLNKKDIDKKVDSHELEVVIEPQDFIDACDTKIHKN